MSTDEALPLEPEEALREALGPLDDQAALYEKARESLEETLRNLKLTPAEEKAMASELQQLRDLAAKLDSDTVEIAAFGMVSRGKSSVLNALCGKDVFRTGATHGTTVSKNEHPWETVTIAGSGPEGVKLVLVDTPGIDEVGGEVREAMAREVARHADLILFVVSGDMQRKEFEALSELREVRKPIVLVFNQIDRYPDADRDLIYSKIKDERVRHLVRPEDIVMTAARPDPFRVRIQHADGRVTTEWERPAPLIEPLKKRILEVLETEGKALIALNALVYAGDLHEEIVAHKLRLREDASNRLIWNFAIAKGAAVALNPIPVADLAGGLAVDIGMIIALSKLYGIPLTRYSAAGLVKDMVKVLGALGAVEVASRLIVSGIKSALGAATVLSFGATAIGYGIVGLAQGATAATTSYILGQGAKVYLQQGCQWGPKGIRTVIHQIIDQAKADSVLERLKDDLKRKVKG